MRRRQSAVIICLLLLFFITGPACSLASHLASRAFEAVKAPTATRRWRQARLPTRSPAEVPLSKVDQSQPASLETQTPTPPPTVTPSPVVVTQPVATAQAPQPGTGASGVAAEQQPAPAVVLNPTAPPMAIPIITAIPTSPPVVIPRSTPVLTATVVLSPTATPVPEYDFMLAEFFNSPTTNNFLLIYVAVVDPNEIPIGGMKIVGTRLDHNLTYESPLSTWHFEGYSAPGHVVKSGNVKFEPPGGIETTKWIVHLEDAHGNRQSADIPFEVDENDKQWYFIKFRRKF